MLYVFLSQTLDICIYTYIYIYINIIYVQMAESCSRSAADSFGRYIYKYIYAYMSTYFYQRQLTTCAILFTGERHNLTRLHKR